MGKTLMHDKSIDFAIRIVKLSQYLCAEHKEFILSKQLLRSGTSIGAMIRESEYAESIADFIHKFSIAQKECNETMYWLELLYKTNYLTLPEYTSISQQSTELLKMLTTTIKTCKSKLPKNN
ncbi:MAG TPA: four helix bundle protein [Bacteroidales bacterium]|nr:four helix bundle protein [Bacteroidales bacterium]